MADWPLVVGGLAAGATAVALILANLFSRHGLWSMLDLRVYYWGGQIARRGGDLYDARFEPGGLMFTYPPFAALCFAAVSFLPLAAVRIASVVADLVGVGLASWLALGSLGYPRSARRWAATLALAAAATWSEPVWQTLSYGQVNIALMVVALVDLFRPRGSRWQGVGVGLAAGFKLTPLVFVAYLLLTGRFRAGGVALAVFAAAAVLPAIWLPSQSLRYWAGGLFADASRMGNVGYVGNQALNGTLTRLPGGAEPILAAWLPAAALVGAIGLLLAALAARQGNELAGVLLCALTGLLVSPVSWSHHWVWVAPGLALVVHGAFRARSAASPGWWPVIPWVGVLALLAVFWSRAIWLVPGPDIQGKAPPGIWLLPADLYGLAGVAVLGLAAIRLLSPRLPRAGSDVPPGVDGDVVAGDISRAR